MQTVITNWCESYLWGIETCKKCLFYPNLHHVWIVPVRDWNSQSHGRMLLTMFPVWIEPVRDWNRLFSFRGDFVSPRVNRTCEELKRIKLSSSNSCADLCESNLWGIETPNVFPYQNRNISVWIVPVRDWNRLSNKKSIPHRYIGSISIFYME